MSSPWPPRTKSRSDLLDEYKLPARLHVIIETNQALEVAYAIGQANPRIDALFFGGVDMAADLRCKPTWGALRRHRRALARPRGPRGHAG